MPPSVTMAMLRHARVSCWMWLGTTKSMSLLWRTKVVCLDLAVNAWLAGGQANFDVLRKSYRHLHVCSQRLRTRFSRRYQAGSLRPTPRSWFGFPVDWFRLHTSVYAQHFSSRARKISSAWAPFRTCLRELRRARKNTDIRRSHPGLSSSRNRARAGVSSMLTVEDRTHGAESHNCSLRVHGFEEAFPSHETQRLAAEMATYQVPRVTHVTGGRTGGIVGMLGPWC